MSSLKILAVSDKVLQSHYSPHVSQLYPRLDLLLGAGDLPYYYLDFLVSALDTNMLYVLGNHDAGRQYTESGEINEVRGGRNIHRRVVREQGLIFAGLEGSMRYRPSARQQYSEAEMWREASALFPRLLLNRVRYGRYLDVLLTHSPPFEIHDATDIPHRGFKSFLHLMRIFRPRYLLHGHIHRYLLHKHEITQYHETTVINIYPNYYFEISVERA